MKRIIGANGPDLGQGDQVNQEAERLGLIVLPHLEMKKRQSDNTLSQDPVNKYFCSFTIANLQFSTSFSRIQ